MATNRSRRLRKKLRVGEFQEFGFSLTFTIDPQQTGCEEALDRWIDYIESQGWCFGGGGSGCLVCAWRAAPQGVCQSPGGHGGVLWLGNCQDRVDCGTAGCGASAGAGVELVGPGGGHGDHDENVLGGAFGAARCPKNRLI